LFKDGTKAELLLNGKSIYGISLGKEFMRAELPVPIIQ
jgi:hypothetical protein